MTKRVKRQFSRDFKAEVARLILDGGETASAVARDHDLAPSLVAGRVRPARVDRGGGRPAIMSTAERDKLAQAHKDLRELRRENKFLRKTAAWFTSLSR